GRIKFAEVDLLQGIKAYEYARERLSGNEEYYTYLDQWALLFDQAISLRLRQGRPEEAWELLEESKGARDRRGESNSAKASFSHIQAALAPKTVLIEYAVLQDRLLIWKIWRGGHKILSYPISEKALREQVDKLLPAIQRNIPGDTWREPAKNLFEILVRPVLDRSVVEEKWIVIPDKFLSTLPFAALFDRRTQTFLVEQRTIAMASSAEFYMGVRRRGIHWSPSRASLLAVASDNGRWANLDEAFTNLPSARKEAMEVAKLYPNRELLLGSDVTKDRLLKSLGQFKVFHFAGHALGHAGSPTMSRLILGQNRPELDLFAGDLIKHRLNNIELVVLSTCESSPGGQSRSGAAGMAWAFQTAGVPAIVATLWDVNDGISRSLSVSFHRHLLGVMGGAEALRAAQLELLRSPSSRPSLHPSLWAAFEFLGELA